MENVKRVVFVLMVVGLLIASEAVTVLATRASAANGLLKVESLGFFYKLDEQARYLDLKTKWQTEHRVDLSLDKASELAKEAYGKAGVESPFEQWRYQGGPAPHVFSSKMHLYNAGKNAMLNIPLQVVVRAKVGELRVSPDIQMTDYDHLEQTARWETVSQKTVKIAALAPGEDQLVEVMNFQLMDFLAKHPNQWPSQVEVSVSAPGIATTRKLLPLVPDHFVVPVLY